MELGVKRRVNPVLEPDALAQAYRAHQNDGHSWATIAEGLGMGRHALQKQLRKAGYDLSEKLPSGPRGLGKSASIEQMRGFNPISQDYLTRKLV